MSAKPKKEEIREKYNRFAPWYDLAEAIPEFFGIKKLRRRLLQKASGKVLEVAVGTGRNLRHYSKGCEITAVDMSPAMLEIARRKADKLRMNVTFHVMDGENLSFPDRSFDTVVDSLTVCTFTDPVAALQEFARVCKDNGRILLLEHGRSNRGLLGRLQDRWTSRHAKTLGCHMNREPLELVRQAGLKIISSQRYLFGIFHVIEAAPLR